MLLSVTIALLRVTASLTSNGTDPFRLLPYLIKVGFYSMSSRVWLLSQLSVHRLSTPDSPFSTCSVIMHWTQALLLHRGHDVKLGQQRALEGNWGRKGACLWGSRAQCFCLFLLLLQVTSESIQGHLPGGLWPSCRPRALDCFLILRDDPEAFVGQGRSYLYLKIMKPSHSFFLR